VIGLVLAAGIGKRLAPLTDECPKGLIELGGRSLLARLLDGLQAAGVRETALVVGYRQELIRAALGPSHRGMPLRYLENPAYARGPRLSLWTGRAEFERDDVMLADGDVLFAPALLERVVRAPAPNVFLAEPEFADTGEEIVLYCSGGGLRPPPAALPAKPGRSPFGERIGPASPRESETPWDSRGARVVAIRRGVAGPPDATYQAKAEWVGFVKVGRAAGIELAAILDAYVRGGQTEGDYEAALDALLPRHRFLACPTDGLPWIEIDFPQDLQAAETEVLPRIARLPA
jgi:choline kinase